MKYYIKHNGDKTGDRSIIANSVTFKKGCAIFLSDDNRSGAGVGAQKICAIFSLKHFNIVEQE